MTLQQMRIFVAVVERGSMSNAARVLRISPTAVSKQIKILENDLTTQLVQRSSTAFEITDAGLLFYNHCQQILRDIDGLKETILSMAGSLSGSLRLFASQSFAEHFIVPWLPEFYALYPRVVVTLEIADRLPDLQKESIDLCLGITTPWNPEHIKKKLTVVTECLLGAPSYFKKFGMPTTMNDLDHHRFVCHGGRVDPYSMSFGNREPFAVTPGIIVNEQIAMMSCAVAGMGLVYSFEEIYHSLIASKKLVVVPMKELTGKKNYYGYFLPTRHLKPAARAFLDFIVDKLSNSSS